MTDNEDLAVTITAGDNPPIKTTTGVLEKFHKLIKKGGFVIDTMSDGSLVISMTPAQSSLKFGEKPEGAKIESPKPEVPKKVRVRRKTALKA